MTRLFWQSQLIIIGLLLCALSSCTSAIEVKKTPDCVASYVFQWPVRQLHNEIPKLFSSEDLRQDGNPLLSKLFTYDIPETGPGATTMQAYFTAETADSALFGKEYFTHMTASNIYLHTFGMSWKSPTYFAGGKPLDYLTDFAIKLDSVSPHQTRVSIETLHPLVYHGYSGIGAHGPSLVAKEVPVPASKPEECALLAYLITQFPTPPL